jgi:Protein of unknown function (DUF3800)
MVTLSAPCSFSRTALAGTDLVRIAYLDEAGQDKQIGFVVVAGVIIHGDRHPQLVAHELDKLARKHFPDCDPRKIVFHAKEIFAGGRPFDKYDKLQDRLPILGDLARIPGRIGVPIVFGIFGKRGFDKKLKTSAHVSAFKLCIGAADLWVRKHHPSENAFVVCEDNESVRGTLKDAQNSLIDASRLEGEGGHLLPWPMEHIYESVSFQRKQDSRILQLADTCAFIIRRKFERLSNIDELFEIVRPQIFEDSIMPQTNVGTFLE